MRVRLEIVTIVNSVFINVQANMAAGARQINIGILIFANHKLPLIQSVSVSRSMSKAVYHSAMPKYTGYQNFLISPQEFQFSHLMVPSTRICLGCHSCYDSTDNCPQRRFYF